MVSRVYEVNDDIVAELVLRTFNSVFPYVEVWDTRYRRHRDSRLKTTMADRSVDVFRSKRFAMN